MRRRVVLQVLAAAAAAVLASACAGDDGSEARSAASSTPVVATTTPTAVPACGDADVAARSSQTLRSGGVRRSYVIEVPASYDGQTPLGMILDFHGFGGTAEGEAANTRLGSVADAIVVTPDGVGTTTQAWSLEANAQNPDVAFTRDLVDAVSDDYCVDPNRVFAAGISNGSAFVALLACLAPDVVAAVSFVATTVGPIVCVDDTTMPILDFHGTADPIAVYSTGPSGTLTAPVVETLGIWAARNGCDPQPVEDRIAPDVVHVVYEGCVADVEHYRVEGAGHVWPGAGGEDNTDSIDASAIMVDWFADHPRSS